MEEQRDKMMRRNKILYYVICFGNIFSVLVLGGVVGIQAWKFNQAADWWQSDGNYSVDEPLLLGARMLVGIF